MVKSRFKLHLIYMQPKNIFTCIVILVFSFIAESTLAQKVSLTNALNTQNNWVDSVYNTLNRRQRIGQLFFIRAHTNKGRAYED
jgi:beta-N-acetylhexosaminidase